MTSIQTTTKAGTHINVQGAGPEIPDAESIPSNREIDTMLSGAKRDLKEQTPHLDTHGKNIASSAQGVLDATSQLLHEKNKEERFQKLILFTKTSTETGPSEGLSQAAQKLMAQATGIGSKISDDATDVFMYIRQTVLNLTTSLEFRQLAIEFLDFLQSMLGQLKSAAKEGDDQPLGDKLRNRTYETEDERNDVINEKLDNLLRHVAQRPEYQNVVKNFMKYSKQIYDLLYDVKEETKTTREVEELRRTVNEGWEILHDFAGRDSEIVPRFKKSLTELLDKIRTDEELTGYASECQQVLTDLMENPDNTSENSERTKKMVQRGKDLSEKYRGDLNYLYSDAQRIFQKIQADPVVRNFQDQLEKLGRDIALNDRGQPDLFVLDKSMTVIKNLLVDRLRQVLVNVPIRRVQIQSESLDLLLTNISMEGTGLVPNHLYVKFSSISEFDLQKSPDAVQKFKIRFRCDEMKPHFKNVNFAYERKTFPTIKDHGVANILFDGNGLSADVIMEFFMKSDRVSRAVLRTCSVSLEKISLTFEHAKHNILDAVLTPIFQTSLRSRIESGIQEYLQTSLYQIQDQLNDWFLSRPFETMMKKGNETLQEAVEAGQRKREQKQREKQKQETEKEQGTDVREHEAKEMKKSLGVQDERTTEQPSS